MVGNLLQEYGSIASDYELPFEDYMDSPGLDGFILRPIGDVLKDLRYEYLFLGQTGVTRIERRRTLFGWFDR